MSASWGGSDRLVNGMQEVTHCGWLTLPFRSNGPSLAIATALDLCIALRQPDGRTDDQRCQVRIVCSHAHPSAARTPPGTRKHSGPQAASVAPAASRGGKVPQALVEMQRGLLFVTSIRDGSRLTVLAAASCDVGVSAMRWRCWSPASATPLPHVCGPNSKAA
jgi:hypothetical protein